jgi:GxxExxY protein
MTENEISAIVVDVCYKIHVKLGPGLLESVYESILYHELTKRGCVSGNTETIAGTLGWNSIRYRI